VRPKNSLCAVKSSAQTNGWGRCFGQNHTLLQRGFVPGWKVALLSVESHTLLQRGFIPGWKVALLPVESHRF